MFTLKIEHGINDFGIWRAAFDRDPVGRQRGGVRRYRVFRPSDDPHYVLIDLDFDQLAEAQAFLEALQNTVWKRPDLSPALARGEDRAATAPRARIVESIEERTY